MFKPILLERVTLRLITHKHASQLFAILNHPQVSEYNDYQTPLSKSQIKQLIQDDITAYYEGEVIRVAIEHNISGDLMGTCGLYNLTPCESRAFIGFELHPTFWDKGVMFEVITGFLNTLNEQIGLKYVSAQVSAHNARSHNLLIKLGFSLRENSIWFKEL
ncbi:GNAT family N-acetyltransferase [Pseudoalteromonas sp. MMG007]|uniref:GNAT family N-acetyltransferase n=1 Tax=Pseudoalteromonas sp. MMG007 TaxID=2822684 RepID=UPI001B3895DC|nr:GNAT family N-acetyltransferase [Pseudoalteromonas sp. MMG007]MBQ4857341.1 GNAT family N-acetyltransferase [Pseudoalteromonas sp. MMG007]